ncbi:myeloid-associated differentiation marker homolog [Alosa pseudoharengus]|uniref:myeloid-associated differentiation marker homolog n=1 Tax=Alosa pseudoharengus TaxID=34774 RepID=UPI003F88BD1B
MQEFRALFLLAATVVVIHNSPLLWPRVLAMLLASVPFFVGLRGMVEDQMVGVWCILSWGFSFFGTLLVLLVELLELQSIIPVFWKNFTITFACVAFLLCLSASITFALYFVKGFFMHGVSYNCRVVSLVFSCLATIAYVMEVNIIKARSDTRDREAGYMATKLGLLKVCETFVAGIIFVFINDPNIYESHTAITWCVAVYCICFILSSVVILLSIGNCSDCLTSPPTCCLSFYALLAVIMYLTATIIWPIYKFDKLHGGSPSRPSQCSSSNPNLCPFDKLIVVAVLTAVNFILYLADLIYSVIQFKEDDQNSYRQL